MGTHSLSWNSLAADAISYLVASRPLLYRSRFKFKGRDFVLRYHRVLYNDVCMCLANFLLKNYGSNARKCARRNMHWGEHANYPLSVSLLHAPLYSGVYLYILDEYTRPKFGSFSKTSKSQLSLTLVCTLNGTS